MSDERSLFERMLAVQMEITAIPKDSINPHFNHKYADRNAILKILKPVLNKHGLLLMQTLTHIDGNAAITTTVMFGSEKIEATTPIPEPLPPAPGKRGNLWQDMGSAFTYWERYALNAMFALEAEDDDGNAGDRQSEPNTAKPKAQPAQADSGKEIPTCSICHKPMKPQKNNPDKWFCRHEDNGVTSWGKPVFSDQKKVTP